MTYANRGMASENIIEIACKQYEDRNLAVIRKVPTPIRVVSNKRGRLTGFFEKKATVDFEGTFTDGRSVAFDSKETKGKSLSLNNIQKHQLDYMKKVHRLKGIAFLVVYFRDVDKYYRLDIEKLLGYIEEPYKTNKKSIPIRYFEKQAREIKSRSGIYLDFLEGVEDYK